MTDQHRVPDFYIEPATWTFDRAEIEAIRTEVFIHEQGVPEEGEWDDEDPSALHFLARATGSHPVGTARLTLDGRIGRIAVTKPCRHCGIGTALLRNTIEAGRARGLSELRLTAQTHALGFYERLGFSPYGKVFDDVGIPHQWMRIELEAPDDPPDPRLRRDTDSPNEKSFIKFDGLKDLLARMRQLIEYSGNELAIYSRDLDPKILNSDPIIEAFRKVATAAPRPHIRILVQDSGSAVRSGHRLIHLAHRVPSVIQFRKPSKAYQGYVSAFAVGDRSHVLFRPFSDRFDGYLQINHRREAVTLMKYFTQVWEGGEEDPNLRRMDL